MPATWTAPVAVMRGARRAVALLTLVLAALAAAVAGAAPASAAEFMSSDPTPGSTVPGTVRDVRLSFTEPVAEPSADVTDADDRSVDGAPRVEGKQVVVPIDPRVSEGPVTMTWRVRDANGRRLDGELRFTVADPVSSSSALALTGAARTQDSADVDSRADGEPADRAAWATLRGAGLVAIMLALGTALFAVLVHDGAHDRRRLAVTTALASLAGTGLMVAAAMFEDDGVMSRRETVSVGLLAAGAVLLVAGAAFAAPGRAVPRALAVVGALVAALSFAPSGHASSSGSPVVAMGALALHVLAMGAWLGGVAALCLVLAHRRHVRTPRDEALMLRRFGTLAAGFVGAGLLGGVIVTVLALPELSSLWETRWGLVVAGKAAAVGVVAVLGMLNRGAAVVPPEVEEGESQPLLAEVPAFRARDGDLLVIERYDDLYDPRYHRSEGGIEDWIGSGAADGIDGLTEEGLDEPGGTRAAPVPGREPALQPLGQSRRALRVRLGAEAFVLAAAAAVSGVLVQADPGAGAREYLRVVPMGNRVAAVVSDDLTAGRPLVRVSVRGYSGTPDVAVKQLSLRVSAPDGTIGRRYDLVRKPQVETFDARLDLPSAGRWTMQLSYRVSDVDRGDATIVLPVG